MPYQHQAWWGSNCGWAIKSNRKPEGWQSPRRRWNSCRSMEAWWKQPVWQIAWTDMQSMGGRLSPSSIERRHYCYHLQEGRQDRVWELQGNLPPFHCRKGLCKNPPWQTVTAHHPKGSSGNSVWLSTKQEHHWYDLQS